MAALSASATSLETKQAPWWLALMTGILNVILGILLLTSPVKTTIAVVWVLGLFWFIEGIFMLVNMFVDRTAWGWKLLSGVLSIVAGMFIIRQPIISAAVLPALMVLMLGVQGVVVGIIALLLAFKGGGLLSGIMGVLSIVFGVILILNWTSLTAIAAFIWVIGVLWLVGGIGAIFAALRNRK